MGFAEVPWSMGLLTRQIHHPSFGIVGDFSRTGTMLWRSYTQCCQSFCCQSQGLSADDLRHSQHNRHLPNETKLWAKVQSAEPVGRVSSPSRLDEAAGLL